MKYSDRIKPISYIEAYAAENISDLPKKHQPLAITQSGEAKVVLQDIKSYEETQETIALLKILSLGSKQIKEGNVLPAEDVLKGIRVKKEWR